MIASELFITGQAIERVVSVAGQDHKLWFREVTAADWFRYVSLRGSENVDVAASARAFLISKSLCEPDGTLALTEEQAGQLKLRASRAIEQAVMALDGVARESAGNGSEPGADASGSGTS